MYRGCMRPVVVKLPESLLAEVDAYAAHLGERRSSAVRVLLRQALGQRATSGPPAGPPADASPRAPGGRGEAA